MDLTVGEMILLLEKVEDKTKRILLPASSGGAVKNATLMENHDGVTILKDIPSVLRDYLPSDWRLHRGGLAS